MHPAVRAVVLCDRVREKLASLTPGHNGLALAFVVSFFQSLREYSTYSVEKAKTEARITKPSPANAKIAGIRSFVNVKCECRSCKNTPCIQ